MSGFTPLCCVALVFFYSIWLSELCTANKCIIHSWRLRHFRLPRQQHWRQRLTDSLSVSPSANRCLINETGITLYSNYVKTSHGTVCNSAVRRWNSLFLSLLCKRRRTQNFLFCSCQSEMLLTGGWVQLFLSSECLVRIFSFPVFLLQIYVGGIKTLHPNISHFRAVYSLCIRRIKALKKSAVIKCQHFSEPVTVAGSV